jgi:broad specificity phosphatase PhoE
MGGSCDLPLCDVGRAAVAAEMAKTSLNGLALVLSPPDEASVTTAGLLAVATAARVRGVDELREVNLGLWEGRLGSDLEAKCPTTFRQWMSDPTSVVAPEGETFDEAEARIVSALAKALGKARVGQTGAVGVVLRPLALGLVKCWLESWPITRLWTAVQEQPALEWRTVPREWLAATGDRARVGS